MNISDLSAIITALGGRQALQELLGVGPSAVSNYLAKGALPRRAHGPVCEALRARGYQIDPASLAITGERAVANLSGTLLGRKRVLLVVGGGIAAYKALEVARRLQDHNVGVTGVMTRSACEFITPLSLSALTGEKVFTELFSLTDEAEMGHIRLAREADLVLVVPATANLIARAAGGFADDLATTILLATTSPVMMAPAMNHAMWGHPATQENLARLRARGITTAGPADGNMACGEEGTGRLAEVPDIVEAALRTLNIVPGPLSGRHALVTSGPTVEPIDPVRFIANRSSGKQGHAIAAELASRGARVTLVSGPVTLPSPPAVELVEVETARQMLEACEAALPAEIAVCAAAVADWHVKDAGTAKLKKQDGGPPPPIELAENPDILRRLSSHEARPDLVVGFAAETGNLRENAAAKLTRKGCDWIVANDVGGGSVFGSDSNSALLLTSNEIEKWPQMPKSELAARLVDRIGEHFA